MAVEAIQHALINAGYLAPNQDASAYDLARSLGVIAFQKAHDPSPTGMMDDETLTLLLWNMTPEELDQAMPFSIGRFVLGPDGRRQKCHVQSTCSKMPDPRLVSVRNAQQMAWPPADAAIKTAAKNKRMTHPFGDVPSAFSQSIDDILRALACQSIENLL